MLFNPKYKVMGMVTMPYNVLFEALNPYFRITGLLALAGYVLLDMTQWPILVLFGLLNFVSGYLLSVGALVLEEIAFKRYNKLSDLVKMLVLLRAEIRGLPPARRTMEIAGTCAVHAKQQLMGYHDTSKLVRG